MFFFVKTGDLIGIVETLLNTSRKTTVIAVRDSEVAKIPAGLIDAIKTRYVKSVHFKKTVAQSSFLSKVLSFSLTLF